MNQRLSSDDQFEGAQEALTIEPQAMIVWEVTKEAEEAAEEATAVVRTERAKREARSKTEEKEER